jgi:hypothetical protein
MCRGWNCTRATHPPQYLSETGRELRNIVRNIPVPCAFRSISLASLKSNGSGLRALHVPLLDGRGNRHLHGDTVDVVPAGMRKATG